MVLADDDDGLGGILGSLLIGLNPLFAGLGNGIVKASKSIHKGINDVAFSVKHIVVGAGDAAEHIVRGLGKTVQCLPAAVYQTAIQLQVGSGLVKGVLDNVVGKNKHNDPSLVCVDHKHKKVFYIHVAYKIPGHSEQSVQ